MERRLAAILAADVVGYSRLVGADEEGTLRMLSAYRQVIDGLVAEHSGRIFGTAGDSVIAEFASPVEAVRCAAKLQQELGKRNADVHEDRRMAFRIGVNLGDVVVEGDNLLGDGVNVAARLQELAEPGGVCVSGTVYDHLAGKLDIVLDDLGEQKLKNIARPVHVWRWAGEGSTRSSDTLPPFQDRPSIAVLPFDNMSGDPEQEFFADGISEDLITALSKIRWFFVIARNSTFTYKGRSVDVTRVAEELGVRYVLEGSVRKSRERIRLSAQLIDATTGNHVWAEHYDRNLDDIFALQDEMTETIVGAVEPELGAVERARAARKPPERLDAWETYQRALWHMWHFTAEDNKKAQLLFRQSQELDSGFATAYAYESYSHFLDAILGYDQKPKESIALAMDAAQHALALDDSDPVAYFAIGRVHMLRGNHDASISELEMALALNPSFAQARHGLGMVLALAGRLEEAAEELEKCFRLSPRDPLRFATETIRALAALLQRDFLGAIEWAQKAILEPAAVGGGYWPHAVLTAALANLDRMDEARSSLASALAHKPDLTLSYVRQMLPTKAPNGLSTYLTGLGRAGLPE